MQTITTVGLDIAKSVFQVHGTDIEGKVIIRRQLKRRKRRLSWRSSRSCRRASWASKPALPRIIGRANYRLLGIRYTLCRQLAGRHNSSVLPRMSKNPSTGDAQPSDLPIVTISTAPRGRRWRAAAAACSAVRQAAAVSC